MANFAAINTVYNHYLTTYAPKSATSLDTHKKSELRNVYNTIVKMNKEAPLYKIDSSTQTKQFAINLKENARDLQNTIISLNSSFDTQDLLGKKLAFSSNEELASAEFIGTLAADEEAPTFELEVSSLASSQVNIGNLLPADHAVTLPPGTYSFDININELNYEFQFNVNASDTNKDLQDRLSRLITNAEIGLQASTIEDGAGNSILRLESLQTGLSGNKASVFSVSDIHTSQLAGAVDYLGIQDITRNASNAEFTLNGVPKTASSNHFTVEKMYELTLHGVSREEGDVATIGTKDDLVSLQENIHTLVSGYNSFLQAAAGYTDTQQKSSQLLKEMSQIAASYQSGLESAGLMFAEDGTLDINESLLQQSVYQEDTDDIFSSVKTFANSALRKATQVSLNPMDYAEKTIVAYKNPGKNYATPYITSAYSGMLFNSYC